MGLESRRLSFNYLKLKVIKKPPRFKFKPKYLFKLSAEVFPKLFTTLLSFFVSFKQWRKNLSKSQPEEWDERLGKKNIEPTMLYMTLVLLTLLLLDLRGSRKKTARLHVIIKSESTAREGKNSYACITLPCNIRCKMRLRSFSTKTFWNIFDRKTH